MKRSLPTVLAVLAGLAAVLLAFVISLAPAGPAGAVIDPTLPAPPRAGVPSEIVLSGLGPGHGVNGLIGPVGSVSDPAVAYPPPTVGFTTLNEGFAGIILANPGSLQMYCINIRTPTNIGFGYNLGTWGAASVNNVGFVARVLNDFYPNTALPPIGANGISTTADQAAAVQAAIWYFSDNYVLSPADPIQPAVAAIVNTVRLQPPLPSPTPPSLAITPPSATGDAGTLVGPFTITTNDPTGATVAATGASMFTDAAGTTPIANGAKVPNGTQIWLDGAVGTASLKAVAVAQVPTGNVYLYSGNIAGTNVAQKLILANSVTVGANASAEVVFTTATTTTPTTTTTTTTTPTTTTTTAAVSPTATGTLPQTGTNSTRPAYQAGLLLVAIGCFAYAFGRAMRAEHDS
jgi:TQXA domain-containing protein